MLKWLKLTLGKGLLMKPSDKKARDECSWMALKFFKTSKDFLPHEHINQEKACTYICMLSLLLARVYLYYTMILSLRKYPKIVKTHKQVASTHTLVWWRFCNFFVVQMIYNRFLDLNEHPKRILSYLVRLFDVKLSKIGHHFVK